MRSLTLFRPEVLVLVVRRPAAEAKSLGRLLAIGLLLAGLTAAPALAAAPESAATPSRCGDHPWCDTSLSPEARASLLVEALTTSEKIDLMTAKGVERLDVPPAVSADGPVGVRTTSASGTATALPSASSLAAAFDPALARRYGQLVGREATQLGFDWIFGPAVDMNRTPLSGRTFESYGEDPALQAALAPEWIKGAQGAGALANLKHFVANTQEGQLGVSPLLGPVGGRQIVNVNIDERTLREIYLPPVASAVQEGDVAGVMCSYNQVSLTRDGAAGTGNNEYVCNSERLLQDVLRGELGFDGIIISDFFSAHTPQGDLNAGLSWDIAGNSLNQPLVQAALASGQVSQETLDARIFEYLRTHFASGFFDRATYADDASQIDRAAGAAVATTASIAGATLLKNDEVLPLPSSGGRTIAVIGRPADTYVFGFGSSQTATLEPVTLLAGLQARAARAGDTVVYNDGLDVASAQALAAEADTVIVAAADAMTEGADKLCLALRPECSPTAFGTLGAADDYGFTPEGTMPTYGDQDALISAVAESNPKTVVVLQTGGPVLTPWRDEVAGLLEAWYPGEEGGTAIAQVLYGDVDPGGRLPFTFPDAEEQTPTGGDLSRYPGLPAVLLDEKAAFTALWDTTYSEGVLTGYRWFDENQVTPAYPFGAGLSYTTFEYGELRVDDVQQGQVRVSIPVTNTGTRAGTEVVQLYLGMPDPSEEVQQPPQWLRDFSKVELQPGETKVVSLALDERDLSYYDVDAAAWTIHPGCYDVRVGRSSRETEDTALVGQGGAVCSQQVAAPVDDPAAVGPDVDAPSTTASGRSLPATGGTPAALALLLAGAGLAARAAARRRFPDPEVTSSYEETVR